MVSIVSILVLAYIKMKNLNNDRLKKIQNNDKLEEIQNNGKLEEINNFKLKEI